MTSSELRGKPYSTPGAPAWRLARFVRVSVAAWLVRYFRVRLEGVENIPEGGVILAGNHVSYLDPVLLWSASPRWVHFVAKSELWEIRLLGYLLDHFWAIPVRRASADREMISAASALLAAGEPMGMFPEGTRKREGDSDELGEAHGGVAFLAVRNDVPVVPVGIAGTAEAWPAGRRLPKRVPVTFRFGAPVSPDDFSGTRKEKMEAMTAEIMRRIAEERDRGGEV